MPSRSFLIASTRSSRSVVSEVCWVSTSRSSSSARRLTAPSRSRSRRSRSSVASISARSGSASPALMLGQFRHRRRLDLQHVVDFAADVGEPALGALEALLGAGEFLARGAGGFQGGAGVAVGLGQRVLGLLQTIGAGAPRGFRVSNLADQGLGASRRKSAAHFPVRRGRAWPRRCAGRAWRSGCARRRGARSSRPCRWQAPSGGGRPVPPRARSPAARRAPRRAWRACPRCRRARRRACFRVRRRAPARPARARPRPWRRSPRRGSWSGACAPRPAPTAAPPGG